MAGFKNEVLFCTGERLEPSNAQAISIMQATANDVSRINGTGSPEGVVSANPSSIYHDRSSGNFWLKQTGTGNTGWILIATAAGFVQGTPPSTDNAIARYNGTTGLIIENSRATIDDSGGSTFTSVYNGTSTPHIFRNSNNTAGSGVNLQLRVAGGLADDPYMRYAVDGVGEWSTGLDNSDSDSYKISWGPGDLATNNYLRIASATGDITVPEGDFSVVRSESGSNVFVNVANTSATVLSGALVQTVSAVGGGNAWFATNDSTMAYGFGIDNADHNWKLTNSNTFVTAGTTLLQVTSTGSTSVLAGDFDVTRSNAAANVTSTIQNTSATASSVARLLIQTNAAGDTYVRVGTTADQSYAIGVDYSDSKAFKITQSSAYDSTPSSASVIFKSTIGGVPSFPSAGFTANKSLRSDSSGVISSIPSGSFTFVAGTTASIPVPSIVAGSVIVYSIVNLGTVLTPQAILTTITAGVGFVPRSSSLTDTSTVNWAMVA